MRPPVEVHVWWAHTDDLPQTHLDLLDHAERERLSRLKRRDDRDRFVLGAAVLRTLVADLDGTEPHLVTLDRTCLPCGAQHGPVQAPGRPWSSVDVEAPTDRLHVLDLGVGALLAAGSVTRARAAVAVDGHARLELRRATI